MQKQPENRRGLSPKPTIKELKIEQGAVAAASL